MADRQPVIGGEKNVGRGVFQGVEATVTWKEQTFTLTSDLSTLSSEDRQILQGYVEALKTYE